MSSKNKRTPPQRAARSGKAKRADLDQTFENPSVDNIDSKNDCHRDEVLGAFEMERDRSHAMLANYVRRYPQYADDLNALCNQLGLEKGFVQRDGKPWENGWLESALGAKREGAEKTMAQRFVDAALRGWKFKLNPSGSYTARKRFSDCRAKIGPCKDLSSLIDSCESDDRCVGDLLKA